MTDQTSATELHVTRWGEGTPAVFVHGSIASGTQMWFAQKPLADEGYELLLVDRRGYGKSPEVDGEDFRRDADDIVAVLEEHAPDGAHLVGHSYGAIVTLYAAAGRPDLVRTLTVLEPPAFGIVDHPAVDELVERAQGVWRDDSLSDREFLLEFIEVIGGHGVDIPEHILSALERHVPTVRGARPAWEADPPLDELADAAVPTLVVSGGHSEAFDTICDHVEERLGARREVLIGAAHEIATLGEPFNRLLHDFWRGRDVLNATS